MQALLALAALLILLGLSGGSWYLWSLTPPAIIPSGKYVVAVALILATVGVLNTVILKKQRITLGSIANPLVWVWGLIAIFFSGWMCRSFSFFQGPEFRTEIVIATIVALVVTYLPWRFILGILPLAASLIALWAFHKESAGRILFSDDHAMFLFRLKLLKENFPSIPFWSPLWNGGIDARDFFATGALNAFILSSPLVYLFQVEDVYNIIICSILWIFLPLCSFFAARILGADRSVAAVAATLVTSSSLFWYRWALKYGTVGFVVSCSLMPLVIALVLRYIYNVQLKLWEIILLLAATSLMLLWSPSGLALLPLALIGVSRAGTILRSPRHILVIVCLVAINLPWMTMMWKVSGVSRFLNSETASQTVKTSSDKSAVDTAKVAKKTTPAAAYRHRVEGINIKKSLKNWQEAAGSANPLFVVLAVPALLSLKNRRLPFVFLCAWLTVLGTVGVTIKPQLELDRMLVIAGIIVSFPIAELIVTLFRGSSQNYRHRLAAGIVGGFLFASPLASHKMLRNELYDKYYFADDEVRTLSDSLASSAHGGRALFTGHVLHDLSGGHLAPLAFWSATPLIASSYAHNIWKYEQPIPGSMLEKGDSGIQRFLDIMNVSVVIAHESDWRRYFGERPDSFTELSKHKNFILFERKNFMPSYILEGDASNLVQDNNSVTLTPLSERVVIKFKHLPFLTSSNCQLKPYEVAPELSLIELVNCKPGEPVTVKSISPIQRFLLKPS